MTVSSRSPASALLVAVVAAMAILGTGTAEANGRPWGNAFCHQAIIGSSPPPWPTADAGPVKVRERPLRDMSRGYAPGLVTKMPLMVRGSSPVTIVVPGRLRKRVFLLYGWVPNHDGRSTNFFGDTLGVHEIAFHPCGLKPRTIWPGGIRVIGRKPVKLRVRFGDDRSTRTLRLGIPRVVSR